MKENGYMTVCMTIIMTVLLSLVIVMIGGTKLNAARVCAECAGEISMDSVMAEYCRELFDRYNILSVDMSYGTPYASSENLKRHFEKYLNMNIGLKDSFFLKYYCRDLIGLKVLGSRVDGVSLLTDYDGEVFLRCAKEAIESDINLDLYKETLLLLGNINSTGLMNSDDLSKKNEYDSVIESYDNMLVTHGEITENITVVSPTATIDKKVKNGFLNNVISDKSKLSKKALVKEGLLSSRKEKGLSEGNIMLPSDSIPDDIWERFLFGEYVLKYLGSYANEKDAALSYGAEYVAFGKESDVENLKAFAESLGLIRLAANVISLNKDEVRMQEIIVFSEAAAALIFLPELAPVFEAAIVVAWSYAESINDLKNLFSGGKVPLFKNTTEWKTGLESVLAGNDDKTGTGGNGLSYDDYLRIFLILSNKDKSALRAMSLIEATIRTTEGNTYFRMDACANQVVLSSYFTDNENRLYTIKRKREYR